MSFFARAVPQCTDIFQQPPQSSYAFPTSDPIPTRSPSISCFLQGWNSVCVNKGQVVSDVYSPGDYYYETGKFRGGDFIRTSGKTTRLHFNSLTLTDANINQDGNPEDLIIFVKGSLLIHGASHINAIIYTERSAVQIAASWWDYPSLTGGIGSQLPVNYDDLVHVYDQSAIEQADFNGFCSNDNTPKPEPTGTLQMQVGQTNVTQVGRTMSVKFDKPFSVGTTPVVFLMPTIDQQYPNDDGPASLFLTHVDRTGFSFVQRQPPVKSSRRVLPSEPMVNVSWLAANQGEHQLPNGGLMVVGADYWNKAAQDKNYNGYKKVDIDQILDQVEDQTDQDYEFSAPVILHQLQTDNKYNTDHRCWFTSIVKEINHHGELDELAISLDPSEVKTSTQKYCKLNNNANQGEQIGYLIVSSGHGQMDLNGDSYRYDFNADGATPTPVNGLLANFAKQCNAITSFRQQDFTQAPFLVAKKTTRNGPQGGWLRRCKLSDRSVSVVIDEDLYGGDRTHKNETYSYMAIEKIDQVLDPIDHFELAYNDSPLTCGPLTVTVKACTNTTCSEQYSGTTMVSLKPYPIANGQWQQHSDDDLLNGHLLTVTGGSAKVDLYHYQSLPIRINAATNNPDVLHPTLCQQGDGPINQASCNIVFEDSGFIFDVPDKIAGQPAKNIQVRAVKPSGENSCMPLFTNRNQSINFSTEYLNPTRKIENVSVNGIAIKANPTPVDLYFNADGVAQMTVNYADAGKVNLTAQYSERGSYYQPGFEIVGSDSFVSRPLGFCVKASNSQGLAKACHSPYHTCSVFAKAGQSFNLAITPVAWNESHDTNLCDNPVTTNFELDEMPLSHQLVAPSTADGGTNGRLSTANYQHRLGNGHSATVVVKQAVDEVGVFQFGVIPQAKAYMGMTIPASYSSAVGRFTPNSLQIVGNQPQVQNSCGSFSYLGQPLHFTNVAKPNIEVRGLAVDGNETLNYLLPDWWRYQARWLGRTYIDRSGRQLPLNIALEGHLSLNAPDATLLDETIKYIRTPKLETPFKSNFELHLSATDVTDADNICYQDKNGRCSGYSFTDISGSDLRYGRMQLQNVYGPKNEVLRMPADTQFVNSKGQWQLNTADNCSSYNTSSHAAGATTGLYMQVPIHFPPLKAYADANLSSTTGHIHSGIGHIYYTPPLANGNVAVELNVVPWLKWFWLGNSLSNPKADAHFGAYRGDDHIIYWKEQF
ncbi:DUF6701 domain-containing protein [Shewanella marina]|uniref:DUF6701 domain-containing protein n=1 Tax=Shewanella marina TaxID=487319 RepID=UPI00047160A8|nr:DUF6701 domain-containing protein [Shewanella marina]